MANTSLKEQGERIFLKCIGLFESRFRIKVKNAFLVIETDNGNLEYVYRDDPYILLLLTRIVAAGVRGLIPIKQGGGMVNCDRCLGEGETIEGDILACCSKCKGGGKMMITIKETINEPV